MRHFFKDSFGVDFLRKTGKARVVNLDLRKDVNQALVKKWCMDPQCIYVRFGTPCGTASKARLKRMSRTSHGPPPLRSHRYPLGLPNISGVNLARVRSANILYRFTCELIMQLNATTVWTLENPWSSLLWAPPYWKAVEKVVSPFMVELDYCMFGGRRKKHTAVATNCDSVNELNQLCDGQHEHAPWTATNSKFATSEEAEYPVFFCKQLSAAVYIHLAKQYNCPDPLEKISKLKESNFPQMAAGTQPSKPVPPLVPEFACIISVSHVATGVLDTLLGARQELTKCILFQVQGATLCIPSGSRLLRTAKSSEGGDSFCNSSCDNFEFEVSDFKIRLGTSLAMVGQCNPYLQLEVHGRR